MKRLGTGAVAACALMLGATGVAHADVVAPTPSLDAIGGGEFTFAATAFGETSAAQTFTFKALKDIAAPGIKPATTNSDDFIVVDDSCKWEELSAGETCTVTVAYRPSATPDLATDLRLAIAPGDEETVLLNGSVAEPAPAEPTPAPSTPVVTESAPAPVVIAPAIVAPVVAVKPAQAAKTATCVKASAKKVVCTLKLGLARTTKVTASLMKGKAVRATASRKGDGKLTLKSSKRLSAKSYTLKLTVAGKTAMRTSVKLGS